jgi:hypothetical protein
MAINVNNVYRTVLLILNQEQRGYITPDEFNKTATQVQLDIFERYFEDLNQQLRVTQADFDYSNRQVDIDDKISNFKCIGSCNYGPNSFALPIVDDLTSTTIVYNDAPTASQFAFYRLGTVTYDDIEIQRLQRVEFYNIDKSDLTIPSENFPVYLYESGKLNIKPASITTDVKASFLRKPKNVVWNFNSTTGNYIYDSSTSVDFELNSSEQTNVITRILLYAGIVVKDPTIIQVAAQQIQQEEQNAKS